jgi:hypothetical protein
MADLVNVKKPKGKLTRDDSQGEPYLTPNGWMCEGFRDEKDRYYERAKRGSQERWFRLD